MLDVSRLNELGWSPAYDLDTGIRDTYAWFLAQESAERELRGIEATEPV